MYFSLYTIDIININFVGHCSVFCELYILAVGGNNACSSSVTGPEVNVSFSSSFKGPSVQAVMPKCHDCKINFNTFMPTLRKTSKTG